jgi:hypothetical protein
MTIYNYKLFEAAHTKFIEAPATLTDADLEQFTVVDPKLAERARARRAGYVKSETDEERKTFAQPATMRHLIHLYNDEIMPVLATYRHKNAMLEERCNALEHRLLELEAQRVIADVNANH